MLRISEMHIDNIQRTCIAISNMDIFNIQMGLYLIFQVHVYDLVHIYRVGYFIHVYDIILIVQIILNAHLDDISCTYTLYLMHMQIVVTYQIGHEMIQLVKYNVCTFFLNIYKMSISQGNYLLEKFLFSQWLNNYCFYAHILLYLYLNFDIFVVYMLSFPKVSNLLSQFCFMAYRMAIYF